VPELESAFADRPDLIKRLRPIASSGSISAYF
jgi:hypothetical protein